MAITTNQGLILPDGTDNANVPLTFTDFVTTAGSGIENRLVERFLSVADRTARNAAPNEGEVSYLSDVNTYYTYNGTAWVPLIAGQVIARGSRSTASTAAAGAQGVLRVDNIPLLAGRHYHIRTNSLTITSSVAADRVGCRLSLNTAGIATTASTVWAQANSPAIDSTGSGVDANLDFNYTPGVNETASVLLWTTRLTGTGNASLLVTASVTIDLEIIDHGVDPGDTGVDI